MAPILKMKAEVTYQCPNWEFCNEQLLGGFQAGKRCCRFCQKSRGKAYCCLHDEMLRVHDSGEIDKCPTCLGETRKRFGKPKVQVIEAIDDAAPQINIKALVNATITEYAKTLRSLVKQGCPVDIAIKQAATIVKG
jgi:hypothetical protein